MSRTAQRPLPGVRRDLASLTDAADHARVSTRTLRRRISDGSLTGYRMGPRLIRVDLNELDALMRPIPTAGDGALSRGRYGERLTGVCTPKADAELAAGGR